MARNLLVFVIGALVTLAVILVVTMLLRTKDAPPPPSGPAVDSADQMMRQLAAEAVKRMQDETGQVLDYSTNSVELIESRLKQLSASINSTNPGPAAMETAMLYGAYAGEVMRRILGGHWETDHPIGGPRSFPLITTNRVELFPVAWCYNILTQGEAANLYKKALESSAATNSVGATNAPAP